ncbi:hypothetical protein LTR10_002283 [Elasticomyces elasticus]|nr:hypothetical protein LTR10_002283 [Elasticomyces elasticus]KAK4973645.1 hypothetical protein LTR42_005634 [Elasticomyces elasticus]
MADVPIIRRAPPATASRLSAPRLSPPPAPAAATLVDLPTWSGPFRLFDLPSELRIRIYECALAPTGVLCLSSTPSKRCAVNPQIMPALLATCRQIRNEADDMIMADNEVTITINAHDTCWPTIPARRLPSAVLARLQHMCLILDCTDYFNSSYADVDFDAFKSLTGLRTLRIAMVYRKHYDTQTLAPLHIPQLKDFNVVAQILERVPASTRLLFGTEKGTQQHDLIKASNGLRSAYRDRQGTVEEASAADLEAAANGVPDLVRGCKSGAA